VEYFGVSSEAGREYMGKMESKERMNRIQQHGEELIDVCFMDMAGSSTCH